MKHDLPLEIWKSSLYLSNQVNTVAQRDQLRNYKFNNILGKQQYTGKSWFT